MPKLTWTFQPDTFQHGEEAFAVEIEADTPEEAAAQLFPFRDLMFGAVDDLNRGFAQPDEVARWFRQQLAEREQRAAETLDGKTPAEYKHLFREGDDTLDRVRVTPRRRESILRLAVRAAVRAVDDQLRHASPGTAPRTGSARR